MAAEPPDEPSGGGLERTLSAPEREILRLLREAREPIDEAMVETRSGFTAETVRGTLERLRSKHLAVSEEKRQVDRRLTARGRAALQSGLPERRLLDALVSGGGSLEAAGSSSQALGPDEQRAAVGILRRLGYLAEGSPFRLRSDAPNPTSKLPEELALDALFRGEPVTEAAVVALTRRGLVDAQTRVERSWRLSAEGREIPLLESSEATVGAVTPALLRSGEWKSASFRPYDVRADVPYLSGARSHPYREWLEEFQEILVGLGFEESEGPLVESEFWNYDVLFTPQEHPARSLHDVLSVEGVRPREPEASLLDRVAAAHEGRPLPGTRRALSRGWRAPYRRELAVRPVLRSQTTAVSARFMAGHPKPPFRMYSVDRNFRREAVDARHLVEFDQCEGILGETGTSLRDLVGIFRELAEAIGIRDMKLKPSYFPFTEPSIEGYVRHPRLGWMEVFPGGMLRPEVLRPLGVDVPVAAWGIGVTRLATVALGVADIRDLYLDDLDRLERRS
jgi:phenylalanyl-tRNA synthetase alpha chain